MNHWIIALPREHMEHCIQIGKFGLNRKHILGRVEKGDKVACYITKEYKIIALGEVTEPYYIDDSKVFKAEGLFIDRFDFRAKQLPKDQEIDFMSVIDQMSFIKSLANWQVHFRSAIVQIAKSDWDLISNEAQKIPAS